ncbi:MAG: purine-binding chemotaxis protein CheW [Bacteroidales bacterium]|nr:purine-binding chemotaxis protein CheW [Bacteroidales bacterium]
MKETTATESNHYISFSLAGEFFAIDVQHVTQVMRASSFTSVPQAPDFLKGVTNFNGKIIPVVNLYQKFGFHEPEEKEHQLIIILTVLFQDAEVEIGILVDSSDEVFEWNPTDVKPYPVSGNQEKGAYIEGVIHRKNRFSFVLKVNSLFADNEIKNLTNTEQ